MSANQAAGPSRPGYASPGYRWYAAAQTLSIVGTMMGYTARYWLALRVAHGSAAGLSVVVAAQFVPMLLLGRRAAIIVTRYRAARLVVITQALEAAGALAIGIPLLLGWASLWYLVVVVFGVGCVGTIDVSARQTFMLDLVGSGDLRRGTSVYATVTGMAKIIGPGAAGLIIAAIGETAVFFADAASFLGVIAVMFVIARTSTPPAAVPAAAAQPGRFRWIFGLPSSVRAAVLVAALVGGIGLQFSVTNPLMTTTVFHAGSAAFGLLGTLVAVGGVAGNFYSSRRGDPGPREFLAWAIVFGAAECLGALAPAFWAYGIVMIVIGGATQLFAVSATVYVQQASPPEQRGQALSAYNVGFMGLVPAGSFAVAGLAALGGPRWALLVPGLLICLGSAAFLVPGGASVPSRPSSPAPE